MDALGGSATGENLYSAADIDEGMTTQASAASFYGSMDDGPAGGLDGSSSSPASAASVYSAVSLDEATPKNEAANNYGSLSGGAYGSLFGDEKPDFSDASMDVLFDPIQRTIHSDKKQGWNDRFQLLLQMDDCYEKFNLLGKLAKDFNTAAKVYGQIIISERGLPNEKKTIKPVDVGGVAGGMKYIASGILFKYALDQEGIFGNDDEMAMKVANHELKGIISIASCGIPKLKTPLMCLVDYRGYRLIAISLLPINSKTLIYGSADGGRTVQNEVPEVANLMAQAGASIKSRGHMVADKYIHGPGDIEVHMTAAKDYYVIDTSRLFPPEAPTSPVGLKKGWHLCYMLRPELIMAFGKDLSADAFSQFQKNDPNRLELNDDVKQCSAWLHSVAIPKLVSKVDGLKLTIGYEEANLFLFSPFFHKYGVNVRKMGMVRFQSQNEAIRKLLLTEMVARTIKVILRAQLRAAMARLHTMADEPFRDVVLYLCNLIVGWGDYEAASQAFWTQLKKQLVEKFVQSLMPNEQENDWNLRDNIQMKFLFIRLQQMCSFTIHSDMRDNIETWEEEREDNDKPLAVVFVETDLVDVTPRIKQMGITYECEGYALNMKSEKVTKEEATRLRVLANQKLESAVAMNTNATVLIKKWSGLLLRVAKDSPGSGTDPLQKAEKNYDALLENNPNDLDSIIKLGEVMLCWAQGLSQYAVKANEKPPKLQKAASLWERAIKLNTSSLDRIIFDAIRDQRDALKNLFQVFQYSDALFAHFKKVSDGHFNKVDFGDADINDAMLQGAYRANIFEKTTWLCFRNCVGVTAPIIKQLYNYIPSCTYLDLSQCKGFTKEEDLPNFLKNPKLKHIVVPSYVKWDDELDRLLFSVSYDIPHFDQVIVEDSYVQDCLPVKESESPDGLIWDMADTLYFLNQSGAVFKLVWNEATSRFEYNVTLPKPPEEECYSDVFHYDAKGGRLYVGSDNLVYVWPKGQTQPATRLRWAGGFPKGQNATCFASPDLPLYKNLLFTGDTKGCIKTWDKATGKHTMLVTGKSGNDISALAFTPGGTIYAGSKANNRIQVFKFSTGENVTTLKGSQDVNSSLLFYQNHLYSIDDEGNLRVWNEKGDVVKALPKVKYPRGQLKIHGDLLYICSQNSFTVFDLKNDYKKVAEINEGKGPTVGIEVINGIVLITGGKTLVWKYGTLLHRLIGLSPPTPATIEKVKTWRYPEMLFVADFKGHLPLDIAKFVGNAALIKAVEDLMVTHKNLKPKEVV